MDRRFMFMKIFLGPGGCLPLPRGYIHVYDHNVQISSLKLLGQSKPNFMWSIQSSKNEKQGTCIQAYNFRMNKYTIQSEN